MALNIQKLQSIRAPLLFTISFFIVAFGQPAWVKWLGPVASVFGYALFWKSIELLTSRLKRFWIAVLWFASVHAIQLSWMTSIEYQGVYILFVYLGLLFWLGLQFGIIALFIPKNEISFSRILAVTSLWTLLEWGRLFVLCGFSWNFAGLALSGYLPSLQFAAIGGVLWLSFWVFLVNLSTLKVFSKKRKIRVYAYWCLLPLLPYLYGNIRLAYHASEKKEDSLSIALVQTGLLPAQKVPLYGKTQLFISPYEQWKRIIFYLKEQKKKTYDLIVLPEAVVPFTAQRAMYSLEAVKNILAHELGEDLAFLPPLAIPFAELKQVKDQEKWLVSNVYWAQALSNYFQSEVLAGFDFQEDLLNSNAAFHFLPGSQVNPKRYDKRVLLPLAEYLPFGFLKPLVARFGIHEFFTPGDTEKIFNGKIPFAVSICYEETFPDINRKARKKGAELFVNITNDNWYPNSKLPLQHFYHGRIRAVENGIPLIRACNTGVTSAVDCFGKTLSTFGQEVDRSCEWMAGALSITLPKSQVSTLYSWGGNMALIVFCFVLLLFFFI